MPAHALEHARSRRRHHSVPPEVFNSLLSRPNAARFGHWHRHNAAVPRGGSLPGRAHASTRVRSQTALHVVSGDISLLVRVARARVIMLVVFRDACRDVHAHGVAIAARHARPARAIPGHEA